MEKSFGKVVADNATDVLVPTFNAKVEDKQNIKVVRLRFVIMTYTLSAFRYIIIGVSERI